MHKCWHALQIIGGSFTLVGKDSKKKRSWPATLMLSSEMFTFPCVMAGASDGVAYVCRYICMYVGGLHSM